MVLKYSHKQSTWRLDSHISKVLQWNYWKEGKKQLAICRARKWELVLTDKTIQLLVRRVLSLFFVVVTADEKWRLPILNREFFFFFFNTPDSQSLMIRGSMFTAKLKTINFIQWVWIGKIWVVQNSCNMVFILHNDRGNFFKVRNTSRSNCSTNNLKLIHFFRLQIVQEQDSI